MSGPVKKAELRDAITEVIQEIGMKTGIELALAAYIENSAQLRRKAEKERKDSRLYNTKLLLRNLKALRAHAAEAVSESDRAFWEDLMLPDGKISLTSIRISTAKTRALLAHTDAMLDAFRRHCENGEPADQRRWRILPGLYLEDPVLSADEIAEREFVDIRTVYRDVDIACDQLGIFLFGVDAVGELFDAFAPPEGW